MLRFEATKTVELKLVCEVLGLPYSQGAHQSCPSPSHSDSTPSCKYYPNNSFYCFGCSFAGGPIQLFKGVRNLTYGKALAQFEREVMKLRTVVRAPHTTELKQEFKSLAERLRARRLGKDSAYYDPVEHRNQLNGIVNSTVTRLRADAPPTAFEFAEVFEEGIYDVLSTLVTGTSVEDGQMIELQIRDKLLMFKELVEAAEDGSLEIATL